MTNAQVAVVVGSGALAIITQGKNGLSLLRDVAQPPDTMTLKSQAYPVARVVAFVIIATWFAGINDDAARIAIAVVIAVWLLYFYKKYKGA